MRWQDAAWGAAMWFFGAMTGVALVRRRMVLMLFERGWKPPARNDGPEEAR